MKLLLQAKQPWDAVGGSFALIIIFVIAAFFYFLPTIIALIRKNPNFLAICVLNFLLGWSFIGWIIALIWSLSSVNNTQKVIIQNQPQPSVVKSEDNYDKLEKLKKLLDQGAITQEEFDAKKKELFFHNG